MILVWKFLASFIIGSIPFAKIAMWGTGVDITKVGSGNPGFNNVLRVSSKWRAAIALAGDISKGYVALVLLSSGDLSSAAAWIIGIGSVMGHCWSPFLGFNGGKGVATTVGVLLRLEPLITLICLPLYPALRIAGRKAGWKQEGAIASLTTMFFLAIVVLSRKGMEAGIMATVMLVIIVIRHASNVSAILASKQKSPSAESKSQSADVQTAPRQSQ